MPPVIGITQCLDERGRWRAGRRYLYGDHAYAEAVEAAGGAPLLLPIQRDVATLVDCIDALLVPGGDDFLPDTPYPADVSFEPAPPTQIDFDQRVLRCALERGRPVLGICYGMQLMALHHGGRLHHHLPLDVPGSQPHQLALEHGRHALEPVDDSRFAAIVGAAPLEINSLHHQGVADPGAGMRVCARAPDGVIEAIEAEGDGFTLGVQWHPEQLDGAAGCAIFRALVEASEGDRS
jgi:putative glutamine amidotransferase